MKKATKVLGVIVIVATAIELILRIGTVQKVCYGRITSKKGSCVA